MECQLDTDERESGIVQKTCEAGAPMGGRGTATSGVASVRENQIGGEMGYAFKENGPNEDAWAGGL